MAKNIDFFAEDIEFTIDNQDKIVDWIEQVINNENHSYKQINFIFCSDEYLLNINKQYLNHDYFTDIITFPYHNQNSKISIIEGDIFISIPRIKENSSKYFVNFADELNRVIIHGVLHLIGYLDGTTKEKEVMTEKENFYLSKLP